MIDQLAKQFFTDIQGAMEGAKETILGANKEEPSSDRGSSIPASQLKAIIEAGLKKMNLVTREEFDAQTAVLHSTREKLEALESRIDTLESEILASKKS